MVQLWLVIMRRFKLICKRSSVRSGGFSLHWGEQAIVWAQWESSGGALCRGETHSALLLFSRGVLLKAGCHPSSK